MTDILTELEKDLHILEQSFAASIKSLGNLTLAATYEDIIAIRRTVGIYQNKPRRVAEPSRNGTSNTPASTRDAAEVSSFPLRVVTRDFIKELGNVEFTVDEVFGTLSQRYPNDVTQDKKPSLSATLSNLGAAGDLEKLGLNNERRMRFRATTQLLN